MHITAAGKKVIFIFVLSLFALFIALPNKIPLKLQFRNINFEKTVTRPDLNFKWRNFILTRKFDLVLGLDLAGGSHLVFEADTSKVALDKKKAAIESVRNVIERRVNYFGVSEPNVQTSQFEGKDRVIVELPGIKDTKKAVDEIGKTPNLLFAEVTDLPAGEAGASPSAQLTPTDLTGADLSSAKVGFNSQNGSPIVELQFTQEGTKKFADITEKNINNRIAIILDGQVVEAPVVREKITDGVAQISGNFTLDSAKILVRDLNAGALPVPVKLVEERTVGATLGKDSIAKSVNAGLVGLGAVLVFMVLAYGKLGFVADLGLIIFGILTLALYKLIPVVLTLPGIAGFLLSVGMAVDSNILIFERFKEEKLRRPVADALEVSFGRAWDSIRDANIATLVTCFILGNPFEFAFLNTSGPVRGFAITLALGIGLSLFTGLFVSRNLLRVFMKDQEVKL